MIIANWFLYQNFTQNERFVIEQSDHTILSETEKAIKVRFMSDYGNFTTWVPKSVVSCKEVKTTFKQEEVKKGTKIKTKMGEVKEVLCMDKKIVTTTDGKRYMRFTVQFI